MIRIGAVNIDTSHPLGFGEVMEKTKRARYVGVYNDSFRSNEEVAGFIQRFGLEKQCTSLNELADMCDIGFIHGCNWDDHLRCIMPFVEKNKPVFVDKPFVGSLQDCEKIEQLVKKGAILLGSSSARYAYEIQDFLHISPEEKGEIVHISATSGVDEFNYGIHIAEAVSGILGPGAHCVRYAGRGEARGIHASHYLIHYTNGPSAIINLLSGTWMPFTITIMTTTKTYTYTLDSNKLYEALIHEICNYMEGEKSLLAKPEEILESVKIMLAAKASRERGGNEVFLANIPAGTCYNGTQFCKEYATTASKLYT